MTAASKIVAAHSGDPVRGALAAVCVASLAVLAGAFVAQYAFGIEPCILCLYQRIPWGIAAVSSVLALVLPLTSGTRRRIALAVAVVLLGGAALGLYSVGVEQHWWASAVGCGGGPVDNISVEELTTTLAKPSTLRPCDQVDWQLFGLSLAGFNTLGSLVVGGGLFARIIRGRSHP
jgi:disulfide bond formation protein DsbB